MMDIFARINTEGNTSEREEEEENDQSDQPCESTCDEWLTSCHFLLKSIDYGM